MVRLLSPAKLNLHLGIVGRRLDGLHLLESLFWPISLCDEIFLQESKESHVQMIWADPSINSPFPLEKDNLVYKLLLENPKVGNWDVKIKKRIPLGGGLGGGSSNVGTLLKYFHSMGKLSLEEAKTIGVSLGADVPFFINPVPQWVTGIGEICNPIPVDEKVYSTINFLLLIPQQACPTASIFKSYREQGGSFSNPLVLDDASFSSLENLSLFLRGARNDLEGVVCSMFPVINEGLTVLKGLDSSYVSISGSGSTLFATFLSGAAQEKSAKDVQQFCRKHHCRSIVARSFDLRLQPEGEHHGNHRSEGFSS